MSSSVCYNLSVLVLISAYLVCILGGIIHINQSHQMTNTDSNYYFSLSSIHCIKSDDCTVICDEALACHSSVIYCPPHADCHVICNASNACADTNIIWSLNRTVNSTLTCNYYCGGTTRTTVYAPNDNKPFYLECKDNSCRGSIIHCPSNAECHINCDYSGCGSASFVWPEHHAYSLTCQSKSASCKDIVYTPYNDNQDLIIAATGSNMLAKAIITCPQNAWCNISCNHHYGACFRDSTGGQGYTTINCPTHGTGLCSITCVGEHACGLAVLNGNGILSICEGEGACSNTLFPKPPSNYNYTLHCYGIESCENALIQCPDHAECHIYCHSKSSCANALIRWPTNTSIHSTIFCNDTVTGACDHVNMPFVADVYPNDESLDFYYQCSNDNPCNASVIHCPFNAGCFLKCDGSYACNGLALEWIEWQKHSLSCYSEDGSCRGVTIMPADDNVDYVLRCDEDYMCEYATVHCPKNASCTLFCSETYSCRRAVIYGPINHPFTVVCLGDYYANVVGMCQSMFIHAENTSFFTLQGCYPWGACRFVSVWFPPSSGSVTKAIIYATPIEAHGLNDVSFYAVNGWNDVVIDFSFDEWNPKKSLEIYGKMHCSQDYSIVCTLLPTEWRCNPYGISTCNEWYNVTPESDMISTTQTMAQTQTQQHVQIQTSQTTSIKPEQLQLDMRIVMIVLGVCALIVLIIICFCVKKMKKANLEQSNVISNGLVVIIVIGEYDKEAVNADFDGYLESLPIGIDAQHLSQLFGLLNYKIIPNDCTKLRWKEAELVQYLRTEIGNELFDDASGELKYDGLIVCISAHGIKDNIITSDYRTIEKTVIHRIISIKYPKAREIPRIFLFDSCEGSLDRQRSEFIRASTINEDDYKLEVLPMEEEQKTSREFMIEKDDRDKGIVLGHIRTGNEWTMSTKNPDYKLIEIHAANTGFQAKCHREFGSYLIYLFTQKMLKNIEGDQNKTLAAMFDEIQNELHDAGKSQTKNIFNNTTAKLKFMINPN
eukprot:175010_1